MQSNAFFTRYIAAAALAALGFFSPASQAQGAQQPYQTISPAQPSDTPGKIEVLEFFAYTCPHCAAMQPMVEDWARKAPQDVVLKQVPIAFNASMKPLQQLYYTLAALGRGETDLSRIGVARARGAIVRRVRGATEDFLEGYEPVVITLKSGQTVRGVRKNGDLFSVQIMDGRERIQGYLKADVREVTTAKASAMPVFGVDRLNESDLNDLLAYLATLRGFDGSVK